MNDKPLDIRPVVKIIVFYGGNDKSNVLTLTKKNGALDLPGGHVETSDGDAFVPNYLAAAIREMREETGINLSTDNYRVLETVHRLHTVREKKRPWTLLLVRGEVREKITLSPEHKRFRFSDHEWVEKNVPIMFRRSALYKWIKATLHQFSQTIKSRPPKPVDCDPFAAVAAAAATYVLMPDPFADLNSSDAGG